jgi:GH25 family lysozyme M1 (1,4-beta-N-acetylmuramidase)
MKVVDISYFQQDKIDFAKLKSEGYEGVIIRLNNANKNIGKDPLFETYYSKAKKAGLYIGAYWFTRATTLEYGMTEALTCIEWLKGKQFEMPIYFDIEGKEQFDLGKNFCTNLVKQFCLTLEKAGYFVGVYCSTFWYTNYVEKNVRDRFACWIAEWGDKCNYTGTYGMWQTGTVRLNSVNNGKMDIDNDICHIDYPKRIKEKGLNGFTKNTATKEDKIKAEIDKMEKAILAILKG